MLDQFYLGAAMVCAAAFSILGSLPWVFTDRLSTLAGFAILFFLGGAVAKRSKN